MSEWEQFKAYEGIVADAKREERERIRANIIDRVQDLSTCHKDDNCQELGALIASYIEEWLDEPHTVTLSPQDFNQLRTALDTE